MAEETISKLAQPYHYTVKTYAQRYDGKIPFTVETSVHLSLADIDTMEDPNSPINVGLRKMIKVYEDMGYSHVPKLEADVKPEKKKP